MAADFDGKAGIVTGGASGIGRAVAAELAARGARVAVLDLNGPGAQDLVAQLPGGRARHMAMCVDVAAPDEVNQAVSAVVAELGGVDMLLALPMRRTANGVQ